MKWLLKITLSIKINKLMEAKLKEEKKKLRAMKIIMKKAVMKKATSLLNNNSSYKCCSNNSRCNSRTRTMVMKMIEMEKKIMEISSMKFSNKCYITTKCNSKSWWSSSNSRDWRKRVLKELRKALGQRVQAQRRSHQLIKLSKIYFLKSKSCSKSSYCNNSNYLACYNRKVLTLKT